MKHKVHWLLYESFSIIEHRRPIYGLLGQHGRCKPFSVSFISVLRSVTHKLSSASQNSCFYKLACVIWNQGFSVVSDSFLWCLLFHSRGFRILPSRICGRQPLKNWKWYGLALNFLKAVFHKFYLAHSWIPWPISSTSPSPPSSVSFSHLYYFFPY